MSIASRARNTKRPSPLSNRPRLFGAIRKNRSAIDVAELQRVLHEMNKKDRRVARVGAFGNCAGLSGMPPKLRREKRDTVRFERWKKRNEADKAAANAS